MLFNNKNAVTEFYPTFLKEDRSFLRKISEMLSNAVSHVYIVCPWITLGEELVIPLENALSNNPNFELYLITKLLKKDVFNRIQQLDDIEKWMDILNGQMLAKYNNNIHSKMIIVDEDEVMVGSSNLTGSGLGSSRNYEGVPQIESNIYTTDKQAVDEASDFFSKIWHHEGSKDYTNSKYVVSCKSYNLSGIYQNYESDFKKICYEEGIRYQNNRFSFKGILSFLDGHKAYLTGEKRKDIAVKITNPGTTFKNNKIGDKIKIEGYVDKIQGLNEFIVNLSSYEVENVKNRYSQISSLTDNSYNIYLKAKVVDVEGPLKLKTKNGIKYLTLLELQDESGKIVFELWKDTPKKLLKEGRDIEIINAFIKEYNGNVRMALQKNGEIRK